MTFKKINILMLLTFGVFMSPKMSNANNMDMKSEMSCCKKSNSTKEEGTKDCCKKNIDKTKHQKNHCNSCGGKDACHCSYSSQNVAVADIIEIESNNFPFETANPKIFQNENLISTGFLAIWLPPKIG